jgi:hypothetical protein
MTVGELCWVCCGITINAITFFIGFVAGIAANVKQDVKR